MGQTRTEDGTITAFQVQHQSCQLRYVIYEPVCRQAFILGCNGHLPSPATQRTHRLAGAEEEGVGAPGNSDTTPATEPCPQWTHGHWQSPGENSVSNLLCHQIPRLGTPDHPDSPGGAARSRQLSQGLRAETLTVSYAAADGEAARRGAWRSAGSQSCWWPSGRLPETHLQPKPPPLGSAKHILAGEVVVWWLKETLGEKPTVGV